jgi:hypothetical protein
LESGHWKIKKEVGDGISETGCKIGRCIDLALDRVLVYIVFSATLNILGDFVLYLFT